MYVRVDLMVHDTHVQREMIKVHGLWRKEKRKVLALEQDILQLRDLHAKEIDEWRVWQLEEAKSHERELGKKDSQLSRLRHEAAAQVQQWQERLHAMEMQVPPPGSSCCPPPAV